MFGPSTGSPLASCRFLTIDAAVSDLSHVHTNNIYFGRGLVAMSVERIAVISDIHGNLPALEAVLSDIRARAATRIICLGDLVGKGPSNAEVVDLIRASCEIVVRGNWDDMIAHNSDNKVWDFYRDQLGPARLAYLSDLPYAYDFRLSGLHVRAYHASALSVYHRVGPWSEESARIALFDNTEATGGATGERPDLVLYGDIHVALLEQLENGTLCNTGSVGNPLDMPVASYVILDGVPSAVRGASWSLQFIRVPYDIERAVALAKEAGMPYLDEYIREIRTAQYRGASSASS